MGAYKYIQETIQEQYKERGEEFKRKIVEWRRENAITRIEHPTNLPRARRLGYKAKQGYIVVRVRVGKGRRARPKPKGGRKQKHNYIYVQPQISHQAIAEQRANRVYKNLEVLGSYWVGEDGNYKFFEVVLADPEKATVTHQAVRRRGRAFRGLTSSGNSRTPSKKKTPNKKRRRKAKEKKPYPKQPLKPPLAE